MKGTKKGPLGVHFAPELEEVRLLWNFLEDVIAYPCCARLNGGFAC